jgi:ribosomal protein L22
MEVVKQTKEYSVIKKRSGRFGVKNTQGKWLNGEDKVKVLLAEGLIKVAVAKKVEEVLEEAAPEAEVKTEEA